MDTEVAVYLMFILLLASFLGYELISKVPSKLHTPLMSGSNAISGINIIGALYLAGQGGSNSLVTALAVSGVVLSTVNVVGGYLVTDRMMMFFKNKDAGKK